MQSGNIQKTLVSLCTDQIFMHILPTNASFSTFFNEIVSLPLSEKSSFSDFNGWMWSVDSDFLLKLLLSIFSTEKAKDLLELLLSPILALGDRRSTKLGNQNSSHIFNTRLAKDEIAR